MLYNPMDLSRVDQLIPEISVTDLVLSQAPENYTSTRVIVDSPAYFKKLSAIIRDTSRETLQGYFMLQAILRWSSRLHDDFNRPLREFTNPLLGLDEEAREDRW